MDFTIILPCRNRIKMANKAIDTIMNSCEYQIMVIDDVSTERDAEYIGHERIKVIYNTRKKGYAPLVNQGITESVTEGVIITCDKIRVTKKDIDRIEQKLSDGFACVCTQLLHIYGFSKHLVNRIGLFDSGYIASGFEDTDWMNKLFMNKLALYFSEETKMHQIGSDWGSSGINQMYYQTKWVEDFKNKRLIQLHDDMNSHERERFVGLYKDRNYLPWHSSELKGANVSAHYGKLLSRSKRF